MSSQYQDYSKAQKAEILTLVEANAGNVLQTARDTGVPYQTIQSWQKQSDRFTEFQHQERKNLAEKLNNIAHNCADLLLEDDRLANSKVRDIVGAMAQSIEKYQLINGLPTSINTEVERQELVVILQSALNAGAAETPAIDVSPNTVE